MNYKQAIAKFFASNVPAEREILTLELYHSQVGTLRYVQQARDVTATLEADAPRNPGAAVLFTAAAIELTLPSQQNDSRQQLGIAVSALIDEAQDAIEAISGPGYLEPLQAMLRIYLASDLSAPQNDPPLSLTADSIDKDASAITIQASADNINNMRSGELYSFARFPTLQDF